jgi:hypothetical protein
LRARQRAITALEREMREWYLVPWVGEHPPGVVEGLQDSRKLNRDSCQRMRLFSSSPGTFNVTLEPEQLVVANF